MSTAPDLLPVLIYTGTSLAQTRRQLAACVRDTRDPSGRLIIAQSRLEAASRELANAVDQIQTYAADAGFTPDSPQIWQPLYDLHPTADQPGD
jgi:hypothetical protein